MAAIAQATGIDHTGQVVEEHIEQYDCSECGAEIKLGEAVCPKCASPLEWSDPAAEEPPPRIGGWLVLVGIGVVVAPFRLMWILKHDILPLFQRDTWLALTTPGTEAYHKLWAFLINVELLVTIAFLVFSVFLAVLFFKRKATFPKAMIAYLGFSYMWLLVERWMLSQIPSVAYQQALGFDVEMFQAFFVCAIWIPYFLLSKRVKRTFTQ